MKIIEFIRELLDPEGHISSNRFAFLLAYFTAVVPVIATDITLHIMGRAILPNEVRVFVGTAVITPIIAVVVSKFQK